MNSIAPSFFPAETCLRTGAIVSDSHGSIPVLRMVGSSMAVDVFLSYLERCSDALGENVTWL